MVAFDEILRLIEQSIRGLVFNDPPKSLFEPVTYTLSLGGKRIRPALTLMAYNIYKEDVASALDVAMGLEVFHNFTLLHDDLMDEADMRRGQPTVHKVWDANTAILSGDAMLIAAYRLVAKADKVHLKPALDLFTQTALEICGGQQYDMEFEKRDDVAEEEYIEMIRLKTAVLLACALKMGAILADAPAEDAEHLYHFGIAIGLAFQLQDDFLDVYGDPKVFGKEIGGDITSNKKTYMLINAFNHANAQQREELNRWVSAKDFVRKEKVEAVTRLYDEIGIDKMAQEKIAYYFEQSKKYLDAVQVPAERKEELQKYAQKMMKRKY